jgi:non-ribosomal peptide synthetase component E (peptide arylation enzyme)
MNLTGLFDLFRHTAGTPSRPITGRSLTFGEIDERSSRRSPSVVQRGVQAGDRLCVQLPNCL